MDEITPPAALVPADTTTSAVALKPLRVSRQGRVLSMGEVQALFVTCGQDTTAAGVRDAAIFALAIGAGLRWAELVSLTVADYNAGTEAEGVGTLVVRGEEGSKRHCCYLTNRTRKALERWLQVRGKALDERWWSLAREAWLQMRGPKDEPRGAFRPLFVGVLRGGALDFDGASGRKADAEKARQNGALSRQAIEQMMKKRAAQAGVGSVSPRDCRRTFLSTLRDSGVDIISIAAALA